MVALNGGAAAPPALSAGADIGRPSGDPLRDARAAVRAAPDSADAYALLGNAYVARARATGDPSLYARAERVLDTALRRDPRNVAALVGAGTLAGLRHDFREQLRLGLEAGRVAPGLAQPYTVIADAQIELGRYDDAARSIQRLVNIKPGLPAYARVSYYRELTGDPAGAVRAMRFAASAGGAPESLAYVQTLTRRPRARAWAAPARHATPTCASLRDGSRLLRRRSTGLARVDAARGDPGAAAARLRRLAPDRPPARALALLAELELAGGHPARRATPPRPPRARSSRATARAAGCPTPRRCCSRRTTAAPAGRCGSAAVSGARSRASAPRTRSAGRSRARAARARVSPGRGAR